MKLVGIAVTLLLTIFTLSVGAGEREPTLPYPYQKLEEPLNAYEQYLKTTPMIPDQVICEQLLLEKLERKTDNPESINSTWVTPPVLAQGTMGGLWSLTEAHLTYPNTSGKIKQKTFSCFVRYANKSEKDVWQEGKLRYGCCLKRGHKKFVMCGANTVISGLPGESSTWLDGILVP